MFQRQGSGVQFSQLKLRALCDEPEIQDGCWEWRERSRCRAGLRHRLRHEFSGKTAAIFPGHFPVFPGHFPVFPGNHPVFRVNHGVQMNYSTLQVRRVVTGISMALVAAVGLAGAAVVSILTHKTAPSPSPSTAPSAKKAKLAEAVISTWEGILLCTARYCTAHKHQYRVFRGFFRGFFDLCWIKSTVFGSWGCLLFLFIYCFIHAYSGFQRFMSFFRCGQWKSTDVL